MWSGGGSTCWSNFTNAPHPYSSRWVTERNIKSQNKKYECFLNIGGSDGGTKQGVMVRINLEQRMTLNRWNICTGHSYKYIMRHHFFQGPWWRWRQSSSGSARWPCPIHKIDTADLAMACNINNLHGTATNPVKNRYVHSYPSLETALFHSEHSWWQFWVPWMVYQLAQVLGSQQYGQI